MYLSTDVHCGAALNVGRPSAFRLPSTSIALTTTLESSFLPRTCTACSFEPITASPSVLEPACSHSRARKWSAMSESQPDHETDIQDLLQWIDAELKQSFDITNAPSSNAEEKFIPISRVESYFQNNKYSRTARLLQAVFGGKSLPVYPRDVAEDCCRVFCILARLGKTRFIATFVHCRSLWDNRLPFDDPDSPPPNFPKVTKDEGFYHRFYEEQWKFCVPELRERNGVRFEEKLILPFIALDREAGGNTSNVYRAVVHEKHDKLVCIDLGTPKDIWY